MVVAGWGFGSLGQRKTRTVCAMAVALDGSVVLFVKLIAA